MLNQRARRLAAGWLGCMVLSGWCGASTTLDQVLRVLDENGITYSADAVQAAAVAGALQSIDPLARVVQLDEAELADASTSTNGPAAVQAETWHIGIEYLRIRQLSGELLGQRLAEAESRGCDGAIIDLRGADGSNLNAIDAAAGLFFDSGTVLYSVQSSDGASEEHRPAAGEVRFSRPVMLLVDAGTTMGAEVFATVLRRHANVMAIGEPTRGDMRIRGIVPLDETHGIYIASRRVTIPGTPSDDAGSDPASRGLQPDILIQAPAFGRPAPSYDDANGTEADADAEMTSADQHRILLQRVAGDAALSRAADILLGLRALGITSVTKQGSP